MTKTRRMRGVMHTAPRELRAVFIFKPSDILKVSHRLIVFKCQERSRPWGSDNQGVAFTLNS